MLNIFAKFRENRTRTVREITASVANQAQYLSLLNSVWTAVATVQRGCNMLVLLRKSYSVSGALKMQDMN